MGGIEIRQIADKSYVYLNNEWKEVPGLSINTVITFLREAQQASDTRIAGEQVLDGENTTIVEYTRPLPAWMRSVIRVKLWISNEHLIPIRIQAANLTQNKIQTQEISDISFEESAEDEGDTSFDDILRVQQAKR